MLEALIPVVTFLTQFFSVKLLERGLDSVYLAQVNEKIESKVQIVLQESLVDFPDGKNIIENFDIIGFFQNPIVQHELSLLVRPSDDREPDVQILRDVWKSKLGNQLPGNYQLILKSFLRSLRQG